MKRLKPLAWKADSDFDDYCDNTYSATFDVIASRCLYAPVDPVALIEHIASKGFVLDAIIKAPSMQITRSGLEDEYRGFGKSITQMWVHFKRRIIIVLLNSTVFLRYDYHCPCDDIQDSITRCLIAAEANPPTIHLLCSGAGGLHLRPMVIAKHEFDLPLHYGFDFVDVHNRVARCLGEDKKSGLILFHGDPGTGKTYYIRWLLTAFNERKMIYVPSHIAASIADPDFLSFMIQQSGSVLVIEDAELIIQERTGGNSAVANLLNLTDGLLADALKCQVICTFNIKKTMIDAALLRKGRLLVEHYFDALQEDEANRLMLALGKESTATGPMTLADIYNAALLPSGKPTEASIGFQLTTKGQ